MVGELFKKFKDQRKERDKVIACEIDKERGFHCHYYVQLATV